MAVAPVPFVFTGTLNIPEAPGLPQDPLPFGATGQYISLAQFVLQPSTTGSKTIDLGTIGAPGAKAVLITLDAGVGVSPVVVTINSSSTGGIEISSGGFMAVGNPTPSAGITVLTFTYTTACTIRSWVLG